MMILEALRGETPRRAPKAKIMSRSRSLTSLSKLAERRPPDHPGPDHDLVVDVGDWFANFDNETMDDIFGPGSKVMVVHRRQDGNSQGFHDGFPSKREAFAMDNTPLDARMPGVADGQDQFDCFGCPIYDLQVGTETDTSVSHRGRSISIHQDLPRIPHDVMTQLPSVAQVLGAEPVRKPPRKPRRRRRTTPGDPSPSRRRPSPRIRRRRSMGDAGIRAAMNGASPSHPTSSEANVPAKVHTSEPGNKRNKPRRRKSLGNGGLPVTRNLSDDSGHEGKASRRTSSLEGQRTPNTSRDTPSSPSAPPSRPKLSDKPASSRSVASKHSRGSNHSSKSHRQRRKSLQAAAAAAQRRKSAGETDLDQMILDYQAAARQELEESFSQYVTIPPPPTTTDRSTPPPGGRRRSHSHQRRLSLSEKQPPPGLDTSSSSNYRKERRRSRRSSDMAPTTRGKSPGTSQKQLIHRVPSMPTLRPL